jgi:hypothetical protein
MSNLTSVIQPIKVNYATHVLMRSTPTVRQSEASGVLEFVISTAQQISEQQKVASKLFSLFLSHQRGEAGQSAVEKGSPTNSNERSLSHAKQNTTEMSGETAYELIFNLIPHQVGAAPC